MDLQHAFDFVIVLLVSIGGWVMTRLHGAVDAQRVELGELYQEVNDVKLNCQTIDRAEKYREEHREDLREHRRETADHLKRIFERLDYIANRLPRSDQHGQG